EVIKDIKNLDVATHLYHIIQEAAKNAAIHGESEKVNIYITKADGELQLRIHDDGFGLSSADGSTPGKGLRIIQHRVDLMEGTFSIENMTEEQGGVTQLLVTLPLEKLPKEQQGG